MQYRKMVLKTVFSVVNIFKASFIKMKSAENDKPKSPQYGGQAIKSQKNIISSAAFSLKTEHERGDDEHHRSPDVSRPQLRQTWRRPKMPYAKLPQVFNQQKQKKKYGGKIKEDMIQNLGKLVENSEYKETQKYLQPLKLKQQKKQAENRNPLNPVKKMMRMVNKFTEQIRQIQDMSVDKFRTTRSGPKISQCITLQVVKRGHNTGIIKKMLHVPTLTLVCVREEPCTQKQTRNFIRDWTNLWREKLSGEGSCFITVHDVLYNYPQGAISIFTQYFKSRSLQNLLDFTATLPESVIRQIFTQLLKIIEKFYNITSMHFGGLSPSQIMFTEDSKVKLSLGLFYHIPNLESYSIYHIKGQQKQNPFDFSSTVTKFMKTSIEKPIKLDVQRSIDVFKIGLMALNCAIGNFQNFQQSSLIFDAIRYAFSQQGQRQVQLTGACCVVHSQQFLLQIVPISSQTDRAQRKPEQKFISYIKLLKDRFSIHFINFLCQCLKLSHNKRSTLGELVNSSFISAPHDNDNKTVKLQLSDLLALGRGWNQQIEQSGTQQKIQNFFALLRPVLQYCGKDVLNSLLNEHQDRIYQVGKQIGLNSKTLGKKLQQIIVQILKVGKQR